MSEHRYGPHHEEVEWILEKLHALTEPQRQALSEEWTIVSPKAWMPHSSGGRVWIRGSVFDRADRLDGKGWTNAWTDAHTILTGSPIEGGWTLPIYYALRATVTQDNLSHDDYTELVEPFVKVFGSIKQREET